MLRNFEFDNLSHYLTQPCREFEPEDGKDAWQILEAAGIKLITSKEHFKTYGMFCMYNQKNTIRTN